MIATNAGSIGTLNIGAGAGNPAAAPGTLTAPSVAFGAGTGTLNFNHTSTDYVFAPAISGNGAVNVLAGTTTLTANNTYTGATTVNGGALIVNGSIASSSLTTVNSGAALLGSGTVGSTVINSGGFLVPGPVGTPGTMTVAGNLAFQSGAFYVVQVNPTTASSTNVSGTASLAGTVGAIFAPGSYMARSYTILTAAGGLTGTFDALATSACRPGFQTSLSYTGNTALLNLRAQLVPEPTPPTPPTADTTRRRPYRGCRLCRPQPSAPPLPTFTVNRAQRRPCHRQLLQQRRRAAAGLRAALQPHRQQSHHALDQLSGEAATGAQKVAFQLTDQFLNLMLDPFVDGRSGVGGADHPALGFAPERDNTPPEIALAYASVLKGPRAPAPVYEPRWTVWGGAYGGSNRTTGDLAVIGSHDLSARTVGFAGGFDYRLTPDTVVGLAFAGGGTNWSLSQGLGGGKSDAFQAGIYGATKYGPAYLAAAFAFANHWMSTDRLAVRRSPDRRLQRAELRRAARRRLPFRYALRWDHALRCDPGAEFPHAGLHRDRGDPERLCAHFQWPRRHRYQERVGRALRPGAGGLFQCGAGAARARRLGARLGQRSNADAAVPGASRRELHRQRRAPAAELRAGIGRWGASLRQRDHVARQVRRRVRLALIDLRRNGDVPIQVVMSARCAAVKPRSPPNRPNAALAFAIVQGQSRRWSNALAG